MPRLLLIFFITAFSLMPLYVFPSGVPQPADFILVFWISLFFSVQALSFSGAVIFKVHSRKIAAYFFYFVAWVLFVSLANSLFYQSFDILFPALFYIFNFFVFFSFLSAGSVYKESFRSGLVLAIVFSSLTLFVLLFLGFSSGTSRQTAGFNNPNQLGYFSLLIGCCATVVFNKKDNLVMFSWVILVSLLGVLASSSLSALFSFSFMATAVFIKFLTRGAKSKALLTVVIFSLVLPGLYASPLGKELEQQWQQRFSILDRKTENISESRGYERIWDHNEYVVFGAGERGRWRFNSQHDFELHSSLGTLLFSYGIVGLFIFSFLIFNILKGAYFYAILLFLSPMVYSLTHQGLRATLFWIFLSLIILYGRKDSFLPVNADRSGLNT